MSEDTKRNQKVTEVEHGSERVPVVDTPASETRSVVDGPIRESLPVTNRPAGGNSDPGSGTPG